MILKKEKKEKKNYKINKFLFIYFILTIIIGAVLTIFILQSVAFNQIKSKGLDLFYARGDQAVMDNITKIFKKVKDLAVKRNSDKFFINEM